MNLGKFARLFAILSLASGTSQTALAQADYPSHPIKLVIAFAPGGPGDILGRLLADRVGAELKQSIVVDNRAGGASVIGTSTVTKADPDGYTILQVTGSQKTIEYLLPSVPFNFDKDLTPIIGVGATPLVLAVPPSIKSIDELISMSKSNPNGINYATSGVGTVAHLAAALFAQDRQMKATPVPYKGGSPATQALMAGQVQYFFATPEIGELAKSGAVRLLAVTSEQRVPTLPDVPTMKELGMPQNDFRIWYSYYAPAKTPPAIIDRLYKAFAAAIADATVQARLQTLGLIPNVQNPAALTEFVKSDSARWKKVIDDNKITVEN